MKVTKAQLKRIIKESMIHEGREPPKKLTSIIADRNIAAKNIEKALKRKFNLEDTSNPIYASVGSLLGGGKIWFRLYHIAFNKAKPSFPTNKYNADHHFPSIQLWFKPMGTNPENIPKKYKGQWGYYFDNAGADLGDTLRNVRLFNKYLRSKIYKTIHDEVADPKHYNVKGKKIRQFEKPRLPKQKKYASLNDPNNDPLWFSFTLLPLYSDEEKAAKKAREKVLRARLSKPIKEITGM